MVREFINLKCLVDSCAPLSSVLGKSSHQRRIGQSIKESSILSKTKFLKLLTFLSDPECLLAYLSFDKIDAPNKIVYDEGPYHNDAQLDGNLTFVNGNFSCGYAVKLDGGEIMFDGSKFHPKPTTAITVAAWIYIESNTDRQTIFATRAGENGNG